VVIGQGGATNGTMGSYPGTDGVVTVVWS